jgi:hypothetical protein
MEQVVALTTTQLLAAAQSALSEAGYEAVGIEDTRRLRFDNARLLQNKYSVVMIAAYETWESLVATWADYQNATVEAMSTYLSKTDSKASDGYLVLLTPSSIGSGDTAEANRIRADTSRLRKLLGTREDLRTISDVRKVMASLLPLSIDAGIQQEESGLDALPRILQQDGIEIAVTKVVVEAFKANAPVMQRLHEFLRPQ